MKTKIYSYLATIYSHIMRSIDYDGWAEYILSISRMLNTKEIYALELASGIGNIAQKLSKEFKLYVASDFSISMLKQFSDKTIPCISCDMTYLPFKKRFNFVFSTFDSINYLMSKRKILKMLNEVNSCLFDDGLFTFDVSLESNSIKYQKYLNRTGIVEGIRYQQISTYDDKRRIHYNLFQIMLEDGKKVTEIHKQRIYHFDEYFEIIDKSNFYVEACYKAFTFDNADAKSERAQFILKKKNKC